MRPSEWIRDFRNRLAGDPKFRSRAEKSKITQWLANRQARRLFTLCSGFVHSQVLVACVRLDLPGRLAKGPRSAAELAATTNLPRQRLARLLDAASALDLVEVRSGGRYALGPLGAALNDNEGLARLVLHHDALYRDLADPVALVAGSGDADNLRRYWAYADRDRPAETQGDAVIDYSQTMAASQSMIAAQIVDDVSFRDSRRLLDIGGGDGTFAIAVARRWPTLQVTVADLPAVIPLARENIARAGLAGRIDTVGLDVLRDTLPTGHDCATLIRILHDHEDAAVARLLAATRDAMVPGGRLLVVEPMAGADAAGRLVQAYFSVYLLAMGQGRPRTPAELTARIEAAGFENIRLSSPMSRIVSRVIRADNPG
ncbi:MAG: methyltransferase [Woeseiaceae bacterium]